MRISVLFAAAATAVVLSASVSAPALADAKGEFQKGCTSGGGSYGEDVKASSATAAAASTSPATTPSPTARPHPTRTSRRSRSARRSSASSAPASMSGRFRPRRPAPSSAARHCVRWPSAQPRAPAGCGDRAASPLRFSVDDHSERAAGIAAVSWVPQAHREAHAGSPLSRHHAIAAPIASRANCVSPSGKTSSTRCTVFRL